MTRKICVLSCDNHPGYMFFIPIVEWIWNKYGWEVALFVTADSVQIEDHIDSYKINREALGVRSESTQIHIIPGIPNVRTNTLAQTVRHFTANVLPKDAYIMVQDIDLLPLSNWWNPPLDRPSVSGYPEMTGGAFVPVHYTGMLGAQWYEMMDCTGDLAADMEREMKANGRAYGQEWGDANGQKGYWDTDWDILTKKLLARKSEITWWPRKMVNGLPYGRVDRSTIQVDPVSHAYSWGASGNLPEYYDAHCESHNSSSPQKWANIRSLLLEFHPDFPVEWFDEHAKSHFEKYGVH